jgi:hypothetical protein
MEKKIASSTNATGIIQYLHVEETRSMSSTLIIINSKWIKNLNVKLKTLKLLHDSREYTGTYRHGK